MSGRTLPYIVLLSEGGPSVGFKSLEYILNQCYQYLHTVININFYRQRAQSSKARRRVLVADINMPAPFFITSSVLEQAPNPGFLEEPWSHAPSTCEDAATCGERVTLAGDSRAYMFSEFTLGLRYQRFDLRGKTLRFTADVSNVPCSVNAAFYFIAGNTQDEVDTYCDMNTQPPCVEIDLFEANRFALQTTTHTSIGTAANGRCNTWGCTVNLGNWPRTRFGQPTGDLYGPGASSGIDTMLPFEVEAHVSLRGALSLVLRQNGRLLPFYNESSASNPATGMCAADGDCGLQADGETAREPPATTPTGLEADETTLDVSTRAWADGMVLVVSLWGDPGLRDWFDHSCPETARGVVADASVTCAPLSRAPPFPLRCSS